LITIFTKSRDQIVLFTLGESKIVHLPKLLNAAPKLHFRQSFPFHYAQLTSDSYSINLTHIPFEFTWYPS